MIEEVEIRTESVKVDVEDLAEVVCSNKVVLDKVFELACEQDQDDLNIRSAAFVAGIHRMLLILVREAFTDEHQKNYEVEEARETLKRFLPERVETKLVKGSKSTRAPVYSGPQKIELALRLLWRWATEHGQLENGTTLFNKVYNDLREDAGEWLFDNWVDL